MVIDPMIRLEYIGGVNIDYSLTKGSIARTHSRVWRRGRLRPERSPHLAILRQTMKAPHPGKGLMRGCWAIASHLRQRGLLRWTDQVLQ